MTYDANPWLMNMTLLMVRKRSTLSPYDEALNTDKYRIPQDGWIVINLP